jgi:ribonuclease HII
MLEVSVRSRSKVSKMPGLSPAAVKLRLLKRLRCTLKFEKRAWASGAKLVAGADEVGRGSLFGPVVAVAVILDPAYRIRGLRDSKLLPAERREELAIRIREHSIALAIAAVDSARIDQINIYQASRLAILHAVRQLDPAPTTCWICGRLTAISLNSPSFMATLSRPRLRRRQSSPK